MLVCNNNKCNEKITGTIILTECEHIFCSKCITLVAGVKFCLFCKRKFPKSNEKNLGFIIKNLKEVKEGISIDLKGLTFLEIWELVGESFQFYDTQIKLSEMITNDRLKRLTEIIKNFNKYKNNYTIQNEQLKEENEQLKEENIKLIEQNETYKNRICELSRIIYEEDIRNKHC
ncbi:hypothetical protein M153_19284000566 [Pseudoloma neurophilia]|uniref:RING-type domain-containing protein n=1 Tax=Pseudoloma neurophilia TaxID=146866 RepID=A0A0R0LQW2_9MICR|nr:hypothetical protein M153_19284000566 [Pseudoloma neurophilia]